MPQGFTDQWTCASYAFCRKCAHAHNMTKERKGGSQLSTTYRAQWVESRTDKKKKKRNDKIGAL